MRELLTILPELPLPGWLGGLVALCSAPRALDGGIWSFVILAAMWMLMAVAMMLPSALPMIRTYCEIADTAAAKGEATVHPLVLVVGYLAVWAGASVGFAAITLAIGGAASAPLAGLAGSAALAIAGLYQFSRLKQACLEKCRNPFAVLFARWSTRPSRVFRLGVEQGVWCLGCCWALMLVMFAVGLMNVFWMAVLALLAAIEKQWDGAMPQRLAGAILLVWASVLLVVSI